MSKKEMLTNIEAAINKEKARLAPWTPATEQTKIEDPAVKEDKQKETDMVIKQNTEPAKDMVNHPPHYTFGKYEVLDVIEDWNLDYSRSCVIKYIARAGKKQDELEDLKKARFYLDREIARLEKKE